MPPAGRKGDPDNKEHPRWKIGNEHKATLEREYLRKRFPSPRSKKRLADELNVDPRRIQVWFQNRRQREKPPEDGQAAPVSSAESELQQSLERYPSYGREALVAGGAGAFGAASGAWSIDNVAFERAAAARAQSAVTARLPTDFAAAQDFSSATSPPEAKVAKLERSRSRGGGGGPSALGMASVQVKQFPKATPGLVSSSDDIVKLLMDFEQPGGMRRGLGGGLGGGLGSSWAGSDYVGGSIFGSTGSLYELEQRMMEGEAADAAEAAEAQSTVHGTGGSLCSGGNLQGNGGSNGIGDLRDAGSSRGGSSMHESRDSSYESHSSDITAAFSARNSQLSPANLMDCAGGAGGLGTSLQSGHGATFAPAVAATASSAASADAASRGGRPAMASAAGPNFRSTIPPVSREYHAAAELLEAASAAARAGSGDPALRVQALLERSGHAATWGPSFVASSVGQKPPPPLPSDPYPVSASPAVAAQGPPTLAPRATAVAASASASAARPTSGTGGSACGGGGAASGAGSKRDHECAFPALPTEALKAIAFGEDFSGAATSAGGAPMLAHAADFGPGACMHPHASLASVAPISHSISTHAPSGGAGWGSSLFMSNEPRNQLGRPELATTELTSWIHAADTVNAVLNSARQHYALAVGRPLQNAAGVETPPYLLVPNPIQTAQRPAVPAHSREPFPPPPHRPSLPTASRLAGGTGAMQGGASGHFSSVGGGGAMPGGASGHFGGVGGGLDLRGPSSLGSSYRPGGVGGLGIHLSTGAMRNECFAASLAQQSSQQQVGTQLGVRPVGIPPSTLDASAADAFGGTRLGAAMPFNVNGTVSGTVAGAAPTAAVLVGATALASAAEDAEAFVPPSRAQQRIASPAALAVAVATSASPAAIGISDKISDKISAAIGISGRGVDSSGSSAAPLLEVETIGPVVSE